MYNKYSDTSLERIFIKICTDRETHLVARENMANRVVAMQRNISNFLTYESPVDLVNKYRKKNSAQIHLDTATNQISTANSSMLWLLLILVRRNFQMFFSSKLTSLMLLSPIFCTLLMCITFKVDKIEVREIEVFFEIIFNLLICSM